jgi:hypothetical protein
MDLQRIADGLQELWERKPGAVVLLALGLVVFFFLVVDAWRHKRRHKRKAKWRP